MKKLFMVAAMSLGLIATTNAQETYFGTKAGINLANMTGKDANETSMMIGFSVGGFASIGLSEAFSVQPELMYSIKGSSSASKNFSLSYLDVPILAKYNISDEIHVELGPQIGLLMAASYDGNDMKDWFKGLDLGLAVGGGYTLESGIDLSLRYITSLSSIGEDRDTKVITYDSNGVPTGTKTVTNSVDLKNSVIQIAVGYKF